jgi:CDP-glycerol glycerophosphotransferase (TagB/SpsB family)
MRPIKTLLNLTLGVFIKFIGILVTPNKKIWIIGSGKGLLYNDNSKYFFEYVHNHIDDVEIYWVSLNKDLIDELQKKGFKAVHNYSWQGLKLVMQASVYIFSTVRTDIRYYFPSKRKRVVNLFHAMPIKKVIYDYDGTTLKKTPIISDLWNKFVAGFVWEDIDYNVATSPFFKKILQGAYRNKKVYSCGMPRTDIFFSKNPHISIYEEIPYLKNKNIISYLPTHRAFGKGESNPIPFKNSESAKAFFNKHNTVFLYKGHYNMAVSENKAWDSDFPVLDISKFKIDTQELLYITDLLISDYSSCYIDYLLMNKPIILYFYDNYKNEDTGLYFDVEKAENAPGKTIFHENDLFNSLKKWIEKGDDESDLRQKFLDLYFTHQDGDSSARIANDILKWM